MTTLTLPYARIQKNIKSTIGRFELPKVNWKLSFALSSLAAFLLLLFYVYEIIDLTRGSYLVSKYAKEVAALSQENKNLEVSFAENSFLGDALVKIQSLNFQKATSVQYVEVLDKALASANNAKF